MVSNPIKMDDFDWFWGLTPIFGNTHIDKFSQNDLISVVI